MRGLKNAFSREMRALEMGSSIDFEKTEQAYVGSLRRAVQGDVETGSLMAGQCACLVRDCKTTAEVLADITAEAEALGACNLVQMTRLNARRVPR